MEQSPKHLWIVLLGLLTYGGNNFVLSLCGNNVGIGNHCICRNDGDDDYAKTFNLECSGVESGEELVQVFAILGEGTTLYDVEITNSPLLTSLPVDVFSPTLVHAFHMSDTSVAALDASIFGKSANLMRELYLKKNPEYAHFDETMISEMLLLESLYVSFSPKIDSLTGRLASTLATYLDFSNNGLSGINKDYFLNATTLETLLLSHNSLTTLESNCLNLNTNATDLYIDLGHNSLSDGVSMDVFPFPGVVPEILILSGNGITTLSSSTYKPLMDAMFLGYGDKANLMLNDNQIDCSDCSLEWYTETFDSRGVIKSATCADGRRLTNLQPEDFANCP